MEKKRRVKERRKRKPIEWAIYGLLFLMGAHLIGIAIRDFSVPSLKYRKVSGNYWELQLIPDRKIIHSVEVYFKGSVDKVVDFGSVDSSSSREYKVRVPIKELPSGPYFIDIRYIDEFGDVIDRHSRLLVLA